MSHIPPHTKATIQLLEERGHTITVRVNRSNSNRYRVDGEREKTALQLSRFFARRYEQRLKADL